MNQLQDPYKTYPAERQNTIKLTGNWFIADNRCLEHIKSDIFNVKTALKCDYQSLLVFERIPHYQDFTIFMNEYHRLQKVMPSLVCKIDPFNGSLPENTQDYIFTCSTEDMNKFDSTILALVKTKKDNEIRMVFFPDYYLLKAEYNRIKKEMQSLFNEEDIFTPRLLNLFSDVQNL